MQLTTKYLGGHKFETVTRGHQLVSDQPLAGDGTDAGLTPPELFLSSIASCAGYYAAQYLNARALPAEELEIHISAEKGGRPVRFTLIALEVTAPGLNKHHRDGLLRAVETCTLSNTLLHPPTLDVKVEAILVPELTAV